MERGYARILFKRPPTVPHCSPIVPPLFPTVPPLFPYCSPIVPKLAAGRLRWPYSGVSSTAAHSLSYIHAQCGFLNPLQRGLITIYYTHMSIR